MNDYYPPIIFVHGILGWGPEEEGFGSYWGRAQHVENEIKTNSIKFASLGPVSSNWDRACELFYQIKGGDCDYGKDHAEKYGHKRILKNWKKGKYPLHRDWDEKHPIHLVGHSQGAATVRKLQQMLKEQQFEKYNPIEKRFERYDTNENWIKSITTISGVHNGSTIWYSSLGSSRETGRLQGEFEARLLNHAAEIVLYGLFAPRQALTLFFAQLPTVMRGLYNWDLDHWEIKRQEGEDFLHFFGKILNHRFAYGEDNAFYDLSLHGMKKFNSTVETNNTTYYFSYPTNQSFPLLAIGYHLPNSKMHFAIKSFSRKIGSFTQELHISEFDNHKEEWWPNDGILNTISQYYPFLGTAEKPKYKTCNEEWDSINSKWKAWPKAWPDNPEPGVWHVMPDTLKDWDHFDIVVFPENGEKSDKQYEFYLSLCKHLATLK
jgi:triacylglycerol lipase